MSSCDPGCGPAQPGPAGPRGPAGPAGPPGPPGPEVSGFVVERSVHLASQPLPAGGAFTSQAYTPVPLGTKRVTYWISYTQGAPGGYPAFRHMYENGTETDVLESVLNAASMVIAPLQPFATLNFYQQELLGPPPSSGAPIFYELTFEIPPGTTGVRLVAAERGMPGSPGTIFMAITGSSN